MLTPVELELVALPDVAPPALVLPLELLSPLLEFCELLLLTFMLLVFVVVAVHWSLTVHVLFESGPVGPVIEQLDADALLVKSSGPITRAATIDDTIFMMAP